MDRVHEPRPEPREQLALAEHDRRLVAHAALGVPGADRGRSGAQQRGQEPHARDQQRRARRQQGGENDGGDGDAYVCLAFLISAEIAGTTACRSPITA